MAHQYIARFPGNCTKEVRKAAKALSPFTTFSEYGYPAENSFYKVKGEEKYAGKLKR
ncbi:MAG: hypothetical protein Q8L69_02605 [Gallionellaceae bacterium]|nr:hypothetical protein [Gallionellaceae bacterium]